MCNEIVLEEEERGIVSAEWQMKTRSWFNTQKLLVYKGSIVSSNTIRHSYSKLIESFQPQHVQIGEWFSKIKIVECKNFLCTFQFIFATILAVCYAAPEPAPKAKPGFLAAAYSAPLVAPAAPAVAYTAAYAAPAAYAYAPYPYAAYSAYSAPLVLG